MLKSELLDLIKEETEDISKKDIEAVLTAFAEVVKVNLTEDEEIPVVGLGKLTVVKKAEREVMANPTKPELGKKILPAHRSVKFKPGKDLRDVIR